MKGLLVLLTCVCSSLSVSVSPGEVGSTCFPLGKQTTVSTVEFFEGIPFLGKHVESFQVCTNINRPVGVWLMGHLGVYRVFPLGVC